MKRIFIVSLLILILSVALVAAIKHDPGYLLLSYGHYTLESSIWVGGGFIVAVVILVYIFFSFLRRTLNSGSAIGKWISGRGSRRSQLQTTKGLIAFIEGNWQLSRNILSRAAVHSETPLLNYLIAARASHALGDQEKMKEFLKQADASTEGASIAVGLTQAELQMSSGQYERCLATLTRVRRNASKHPHVLHLLRQAYQGLNDWQEVINLLPDLKKYKVLSADQLDQLELQASKELIVETAKARGNISADNIFADLQSLWKKLPKSATSNGDVLACYAGHIMAVGGMQQAEKLIYQQLKKSWNKSLVELYGKVLGDDVSRQLLRAEAWLQERNNDATLLIALGRLSLRNSLWGKAKEYFENSLKFEDSGEACAELGRLLAHMGEHEKSNAYFQRGLMLATDGLIDLPMPK
ncbi:MAG: heme biosynthesis protein HemY [Spongiibacteraceae bacterium]